MLLDRIIGAFTFRKGIYADVERDESFTTSAWIIVVVVSFLSQLGNLSTMGLEQPVRWLVAALISTIFAVAGFALGAFVISWLGKTMFNADVSFTELVRTLGLASVWRIIGVIGVLGAFGRAFTCLLAPITFAGWIFGLVAWWFAAKEALDLEWVQTIIVVIVGFVIVFLVTGLGSLVLGMLGFTVGTAASLF